MIYHDDMFVKREKFNIQKQKDWKIQIQKNLLSLFLSLIKCKAIDPICAVIDLQLKKTWDYGIFHIEFAAG